MEQSSQAAAIEELRVEVAALRLIARSIVAQLMIATDKPIPEALAAFEEAVARMSPDQVGVPDMDAELHHKAFKLASKRAKETKDDIGALVRRPRSRKRDAA